MTLLRTFGRFGSFFLRLKPTIGSTSLIKKDGHTSPKTTREMPMIGSIVMTIVSHPISNGIKPPHVRDPNGVKLLMRRTTWRKVLVRRPEELLPHLNVDAIPGAVLVAPLPVIRDARITTPLDSLALNGPIRLGRAIAPLVLMVIIIIIRIIKSTFIKVEFIPDLLTRLHVGPSVS